MDCTPEVRRIEDDAELSRQYDVFRKARSGFMQRIASGDVETMKQAWQKYYFVGAHPDGTKADRHVQKLRLARPTEASGDTSQASPDASDDQPGG